MPKKRTESSTSRRKLKTDVSNWLHRSLKVHQFLGVSLGGGKTSKTCVAIVEYYPEYEKVFLSHLEEKIGANKKTEESPDEILFRILEGYENQAELVAVDVPLKLPKCIRCRLKCPGAVACKEPEIMWLNKQYKQRNQKKRPAKTFTPYTERCAEVYIAENLEEKFDPQHALGANTAPLTARAHYLFRRLNHKKMEVHPKVSLWRIGRSLGIQKSYLRNHKHSFDGKDVRSAILDQLIDRDIAFLYHQDQKSMVDHSQAFDAFLCALTGVLKFKGQVEKRPKDFPRGEAWIEIPKKQIDWP